MAILTEDMKRVIREQRLAFYATVCEDGSPNLSPKGTTYVLDDDHLFFADIRSPQTVANIRRGSLVEWPDPPEFGPVFMRVLPLQLSDQVDR
jgi:predicted pyridoxine 5'-phosphate oxidase superfamily flavin-nucleotide-binding protein